MKTKEQVLRRIKKTKSELGLKNSVVENNNFNAKSQKEAYLIGKLAGQLDALYWVKLND